MALRPRKEITDARREARAKVAGTRQHETHTKFGERLLLGSVDYPYGTNNRARKKKS